MITKLKLVLSSMLVMSSAVTSHAYEMDVYENQPKYSDNEAVDVLVKTVHEASGFKVQEQELSEALRASDLITKDVYSSDGYKVGRIYDILFGVDGNIIFIVSSHGMIPGIEIGDTERAIYSHTAYILDNQQDVHLIMTKEDFEKEPIVK